MLKIPPFFIIFLFAGCCFFTQSGFAQPIWTINPFGKEKKPEQYEEKLLPSEKTGEKKFTTFKRFVTNTTTHYNFYYNANNKLDAVLERAKMAQNDDFTKLLNFYPYTLENTSAQKTELDSVIYKATAGILLHDLRSDWVDNMYLLIGQSYYYLNQMDSAALTFQFINYNLFPRKKNEDGSRVVGTNDAPGSSSLTIANKENPNILQKTFSMPPSRNEALIWLARTLTTHGSYGDASGLINILQHDQNLPKRLKSDLEEVTAYWFYQQNMYDSVANHLQKALDNADSKQDQSRWEFLLAQLYEMNGEFDNASKYYGKASTHTVNLVMDIQARLNDAKMLRDLSDPKQLDNSIENLLKMAKKDRFENYRDIIYYSAAQLALQKPDTIATKRFLIKSVSYNNENIETRNKSFFQLGNISYSEGYFRDAYSFYDSLKLTNEEDYIDEKELAKRKDALGNMVVRISAIEREDSLQKVAALSPAERDAYVKKILRTLRKAKGLKEEDTNTGNAPLTFANSKQPAPDLFESNTAKGEWYFYNNARKIKGQMEFVRKWGKRENTDNWRYKKSGGLVINNIGPGGDPGVALPNPDSMVADPDLNFDALMANLPLTTEKLDSSYDIIAINLLGIALIFQEKLQEYPSAIKKYQEFLMRFPEDPNVSEAYLGLYYCYVLMGEKSQADYYKNLLTSKFAGSKAAKSALDPSYLEPDAKNPTVTARYEAIYNLFIEGDFEKAFQDKEREDSVYGTNYWTPQLLYIQAVYYIKENQDSNAIAVLQNLQNLYPESPLRDKAATLVDVLGRRKEIEEYLTKLEVTRQEEDKVVIAETKPVQMAVTQAPVAVAPDKSQPSLKPSPGRDTAAIKPIATGAGFSIEPEKSQYVAMVMFNVEGTYINETKNAFGRYNKESYLTQNLVINKDAVDADIALLLFSKFEDAQTALAYYEKIKKAAPKEISWLQPDKYTFIIISESNLEILKTNKDLIGYMQLLKNSLMPDIVVPEPKAPSIKAASANDTLSITKPAVSVKKTPIITKSVAAVKDTSSIKPIAVNAGFSIEPEKSQFVAMVLYKVDGTYTNEAKNAFTRFNRESYLTQNLVITKDPLDAERTLLLFSKFDDVQSAMVYFDKIKRAAPAEISWLPVTKYSFIIISESNLQVLKENKDLDGYKKLLNTTFGNKF